MILKNAVPRLAFGLAAAVMLISLLGCGQLPGSREEVRVPGSDPERGRELLGEYGCQSCHSIPGVAEANAMVAPPLDNWAERSFIAGQFPNEPEHLLRWIMDPQEMIPETAMPDLGVTEQDALDMSAYLYTLTR